MEGSYTFSQVPSVQIPRSVFNRSHGHKTTFDAGYLIPFYVDEALPGDTFTVRASMFARLQTPVVPFMDNLRLDVFFFAVPLRLLWDKWQKMMGERDNPGDSIDFQTPVVTWPVGGYARHSLSDYFGIPVGNYGVGDYVTAFHHRAYNRIWNEWFRDENLQQRVPQNTGDGPDSAADYVLLKRGKRHDYFTSCLPWPQKAVSAVSIPLGSSAPVNIVGDGSAPTFLTYNNVVSPLKHPNSSANVAVSAASSGATVDMKWSAPHLSGTVDLSNATAATINELREAFQVQRLLERDARGGSRYTEILRSHFGVVSPDQRLQRPEYLGGGSVDVRVNPVAQTSASNAQPTPQGNLAAYAVAGGQAGFTKAFTEHCVLMGLVMARADLSYQQGMPRMFSRRTRYDFYWPSLAHLGEQAVLNKEIFLQGNATDQEVFGYQERWAEYRYAPSKITGAFRSTDATSLDAWHLAQEFAALPTLGAAFIQEDPPLDRVVAVPSEPHFLFDSHLNVRCARPMPTYSVPGLIDHF